MALLVEYSITEGKAAEQVDALQSFVKALKTLNDDSFGYSAYATDDPTKFIAVLDFDDDAAKQRFLDSQAFADYRDGTKGRFVAPPATTNLSFVASTRR